MMVSWWGVAVYFLMPWRSPLCVCVCVVVVAIDWLSDCRGVEGVIGRYDVACGGQAWVGLCVLEGLLIHQWRRNGRTEQAANWRLEREISKRPSSSANVDSARDKKNNGYF